MAIKHTITLYDVRSTLSSPAWSPNVWKIRFILNYKRLPYVTHWLSYPDIAEVLSSVGAPPTRTTKPMYTVPAIRDEVEGSTPVVLSDSATILAYLEKTYPTPSIFPNNSRDAQMTHIAAIEECIYARMVFMVVPNTVRILEGRDLEYYLASRKEFLGVALEDMFPVEKRQAMWAELREGLDEISALVDNLKQGFGKRWMFSCAATPSYADFVLGAMLVWFRRAGPEGGWDRIRGWNGGRWERLLHDLQPYLQVS
ncbi:hypothetical protein WOLCODRAFT_74362 [Wolfiporia cocos MD-104 SS10]|uniref:GST N-terminal domain-containing protein n=1 Tax=Wolfiporia cocos (strain MD-104) TaxID=742152 RepID=A0A2H3JW98_WOLCO|nr:hypothetical protein WOLCODRAFT_74362 [Wolfiporia cocos MD-104 SS10]